MKAIIFNGALERRPKSTSGLLSKYFTDKLETLGISHEIFALADSGVPLYDITHTKIPLAVERMTQLFLEADVHFWLAPLYHGSIPGVMKNCLDWLEVTADQQEPYLTDKTIGLVCWADGLQAMQGINTMDAIAKSLRAWPVPFSVPMIRTSLFDSENNISQMYTDKLDRLISITTTNRIEKILHSKI